MRFFILFNLMALSIIAESYGFDNSSLKNQIEAKSNYYKSMNTKNNKYLTQVVNERYKELSGLIASKWGEKNVVLSTNSIFTQYNKDFNARKSIDFKDGNIKLEVVVDVDEKKGVKYFQKKLKTLLNETVSEAVEKDPMHSNVKNINIATNVKLKELATPKKITITQSQINEKYIKLDGKTKKIISAEVKLIPKHLQKRVALYLPLVKKYSKKYNLKISYVLGTIHTESYFNPMAVSKANAYGLMQIVPSTGGAESYFILYGERKAPTSGYLLNPKNNIELGTNYMQVIRDKYLSGIKNSKSQEYCMSIAYNAGIGNVYRVFANGKIKRNEAFENINQRSSQNVYRVLRTSQTLTEEARKYVYLIQKYARIYTKYDVE